MKLSSNMDVRMEILRSGLTYKDVAQQMKVSQVWLSTVLGRKLTPTMRERINCAIDELSACRRTDRRRVQQ